MLAQTEIAPLSRDANDVVSLLALIVDQGVDPGEKTGTWRIATLMYAGSDRRSAIRRMVPLLGSPPQKRVGIGLTGVFPAAAVSRRMVEGSLSSLPRRWRGGPSASSQAPISAHKNPASSRAIAVATVLVEVFLAARRRNFPQRWSWARHARAIVSSEQRFWRFAITGPTKDEVTPLAGEVADCLLLRRWDVDRDELARATDRNGRGAGHREHRSLPSSPVPPG